MPASVSESGLREHRKGDRGECGFLYGKRIVS